MRLPVNELSNFSVDIKGSYNKVYSSFTEKATIDTLTAAETESVKSMTTSVPTAGPVVRTTGTTSNLYAGGGNVVNVLAVTGQVVGTSKQNPYLKYAAKIGTGNAPKYEIICTSCVIDFK